MTDTRVPPKEYTPICGEPLCGACTWSHLPYAEQLRAKVGLINEAFSAQKLPFECDEILPSPCTEHYRNRMDYAIDFEGRVGLRQKGKWWRVIDNHPCIIGDKLIVEVFSKVRRWARESGLSFFDRKKHTGFLRYGVIRASASGAAMISIISSVPADDAERAGAEHALSELASAISPQTLVWGISKGVRDVSFGDELRVVSGDGYIEECVNGFSYRISPNAFFQTNSRAATLLLNQVVRAASGLIGGGTLLDLYCGTGFFSIALSNLASKTVGIEISTEAILDARKNAELNQTDVEFHDALSEKYDWTSLRPALVIVDPPRSGLHPTVLSSLMENKPPSLIYVSCNYEAFAVELSRLSTVYRVSSIKAVDMFPHTPHVEVVTSLVMA